MIEAGAVAATLIPPAAAFLLFSPQSLHQLASGLQQLFSSLFTGLGLIKRKRKSYGLVFNSLTNTPLPSVYLLFYSDSGNLQIAYTENDGRFSLNAPSDTYSIKAEKLGYLFPSRLLTVPENATYSRIYRPGDPYEVVGEPVHPVAIPLDPQTPGRLFLKVYLQIKNFTSYILVRYHLPITVFGLGLSAYAVWISPVAFNKITFVSYAVAFLLSLRHTLSRRTWGLVQYRSGRPAAKVLLRLYRQKVGEDTPELYTALQTDERGRYLFTPEPGDYSLQVLDHQYNIITSRNVTIDDHTPRLNQRFRIPYTTN